MREMSTGRPIGETSVIAGIDACPKGWVAVRLAPAGLRVARGAQLDELIAQLEPLAVIAIDMPIGRPATFRECDRLARTYVKPRHNSVFSTPPAAVLAAPSFDEANERAHQLVGMGISQQAWALRANIAVVQGLADEDARIIEVHPEVSFRALVGTPIVWPKTSWNGQAARRHALAAAGIDLPEMLEEACGGVPPADVLDAAVAAWSARRYATGDVQSLPPSAQRGERQVIWY